MNDIVAGNRFETGIRLEGDIRPDLLRDEVLSEIFSATAKARPDHPALIFGRERLSYGELDARSDAIAGGLIEKGIGPGDVVGLWMQRGAELLVAQIGITKSGAAWLPFDADAPVDRIAVCLQDAEAKGLLTSAACKEKAQVGCPVWTLQDLNLSGDKRPLDLRARGLTPDHPAYLIYTSGSTGMPKGIVISHRNICHFLRSGNEVYGLRSDDIVFQGASVAFDLSMEEIWIPYLVGATLFIASAAMLGDLETLPDRLEAAGVTVLDTVPTLLAILPRDIPAVRLILLGGEALPLPLASRWARPGRRIFNTYGPTEATVVATVSEVRAGEAVTIGRPLPNYVCTIADEALHPVAPGVQGELLIGGPGIAQGYLKRPELSAEKFIANPLDPNERLYRSGDAVSLDANGALLFHGRIDDQVKIRGFRVELGEIEAKLVHRPGIARAAVILNQDSGIDRLTAFLVPEAQAAIDKAELRAALREQLPPYMIPNHFEIVSSLPVLSSGKVDRKALKALPLTLDASPDAQEDPRNETERVVLAAAKRAFGNEILPFDADFFTDLGGHSLIAARFVSVLRETPALAAATLQDVYTFRSLRKISDHLIDRHGGAEAVTIARDLSFTPPPLLRRFFCGLAQAVVLPFVIALSTSQWLGIFVTYLLITGQELGFWTELVGLLSVYVAINVVTALIAVAGKWLILGHVKPGRYPLWGVYYFRIWFAKRLMTLVHIKWLQGSPAIRIYLRALGASVGKNCLISDLDFGAVDLISIGRGVTIGTKVKIANAEIIGNELVIGRVVIGDDVSIGSSCVVGSDVDIGDHSELLDLTALPPGTRVGRAEIWDGSPGRKIGSVDVDALPAEAQASKGRRRFVRLIHFLGLAAIPPVSLLPIFPAFMLFDQIDDTISAFLEVNYLWYLPLLAWPTAMGMVALTVLLIALVRWLVLPRASSGTYSIYSGFYLRKWIVALATEVTLETLSSLYATIYMRAWYRLMGARIGSGAEISTNLSGRYDITEIGAKNFIADEVVFGDEEIRRGWMHLEPVRTGSQVFVGNDAVVPPGAVIPEGVLIGIKSKPPANDQMKPFETWFGSPPIRLPARQKVDLGALLTYEPRIGWKLGRALFEAFHTSFPAMLFISFGILSVDLVFDPLIQAKNYTALAGAFVAISVAIAIAQALIVAGVKWLLMGRYEPVMKPMWSFWAMRTEAVAVLYWGLAGKVLLEHLRGTPFLPWILRLFGCRFGQGVYMNTTDITEFDCVTVGDFCTINALSALQTHLYEDRVMKVGRIRLGQGVCVGANATVLYDTHIGDYARLGPLTVVMKGESIPAHTEWEGAPARPKPLRHPGEGRDP